MKNPTGGEGGKRQKIVLSYILANKTSSGIEKSRPHMMDSDDPCDWRLLHGVTFSTSVKKNLGRSKGKANSNGPSYL